MASTLCYDPLSKEFELIMADALTLFVQTKINDNDLRLDRFLMDYFRKVKLGEHVFQRSYEFISGSDHNKRMFISLFWKTYHHLAFTPEPLTEGDYYNFLLFLCPDMPRSIVNAAFQTICLPVENKLLFFDFIHSFQLSFFYRSFIDTFRENLKFCAEKTMTKEKVIETAIDVHNAISDSGIASSAGALPPAGLVKQAFINVEFFENWKSVQDCLVRSDGINNVVGILPLRTTMSDHDSLRSVIPSDWGRRHSLQPTILTLAAHASAVPTPMYDTSGQTNGMLKSLTANLSSTNKLLRRPSRQIKLSTQNANTEIPESFPSSEQSSVAESAGVASGFNGSSQRGLRGATRARLPSIATGQNSGKLHVSNSVPCNLSSQVLDEQSSSDDASSLSSDADN